MVQLELSQRVDLRFGRQTLVPVQLFRGALVFQEADGLPCSAVTAMSLDGQNLWLGGSGFVALVDLTKGSVQKFAHITTRAVDQIEVGGGYLWAKFDRHLYRASLQDL